MKSSRKVVLFFPAFASTEATAPLGLLAIATPLLQAGFDVRLIDSTITPGYKQRVLEEVRDALTHIAKKANGRKNAWINGDAADDINDAIDDLLECLEDFDHDDDDDEEDEE